MAAGAPSTLPLTIAGDVGNFTVTLTVHSLDSTSNTTPGNNTRRAHAMGIVAKEKDSLEIWRAEFTADYVEEISRRTGNVKKYRVFVEMLASALRKMNSTVSLSVLTAHDLVPADHHKLKGPGATPFPPSNKRYLVLAYEAAFDRVFYPLPLVPQDDYSPESARRVVRALRKEVEKLRGVVEEKDGEIARLGNENRALRRNLEQALSRPDKDPYINGRNFTRELDQLQRDIITDDGSSLSNHLSRLEDVMRALLARLDTRRSSWDPLVRTRPDVVSDLHERISAHARGRAAPWDPRPKRLEESPERGRPRGRSTRLTSPATRSSPYARGSTSATSAHRHPLVSPRATTLSPRPRPAPMTYRAPTRSLPRSTRSTPSRSRSPSPFPRFDPTAYIRAREGRLQEAREKGRGWSPGGSPGRVGGSPSSPGQRFGTWTRGNGSWNGGMQGAGAGAVWRNMGSREGSRQRKVGDWGLGSRQVSKERTAGVGGNRNRGFGSDTSIIRETTPVSRGSSKSRSKPPSMAASSRSNSITAASNAAPLRRRTDETSSSPRSTWSDVRVSSNGASTNTIRSSRGTLDQIPVRDRRRPNGRAETGSNRKSFVGLVEHDSVEIDGRLAALSQLLRDAHQELSS
ncbi:hypothetical protein M427DRAFT_388342 [Gonapodya prolifera JEL478]|uniref:Uncharacterized protein n=1 Tax=Gonapodya prolifera (strain JEL478) TaxID=1344416 RepID=A0A139A876_GONPJ|nr:hypothetical protein M427DRAFT_388342 [Gonapodya prolifera JEL478]|eukprot:KXS13006.1 hypothetical protein M427DRAFT_388342 [Gonapodya prolifera JEL478]